jgi:two-component system catabolic regulation response regulator CreB
LLAEVRQPESVERGARPKVLVVEDDGAVARVMRFCLRQAGFDASEVAVGGEALRILQQQPPDAVLLDLQLPDGQGGAVLDWLRRSSERTTDSPVWVVMSALDQETAKQRFGPLGSHFLAKPFDPWELVAILRTLLSAKS